MQLEASFSEIVERICQSVDARFGDLKNNALYECLIPILDVNSWPKDENSIETYGDDLINELVELWKELLESNNCDVRNIPTQWDILKNRVKPMLGGNEVKYLDIWARVLTNSTLKSDCCDVFHIIELLMITPFTNAKLERMFSRMNRVKTDFRNKLSRERLELYTNN